VKAYIRKSTVLFAMKDYIKAMEVTRQAFDADTEKKHTTEIDNLVMKINIALSNERTGETEEQTLQRAMRDPEVAVRSVLMYYCIVGDCFLGHHDRSCYAIDFATGSRKPGCTTGAYEESHDPAKDIEAGTGRCHKD
jgi:hypothetical protein